MISRRQLLSFISVGVLVPNAVRAMSHGGTAVKVEESDANAQALKYVEVSEVKGQNCANCVLYRSSDEDGWGACSALQNNLVAEKGWCIAWVKG